MLTSWPQRVFFSLFFSFFVGEDLEGGVPGETHIDILQSPWKKKGSYIYKDIFRWTLICNKICNKDLMYSHCWSGFTARKKSRTQSFRIISRQPHQWFTERLNYHHEKRNKHRSVLTFACLATDAKNLTAVEKVEQLREKVYASLEEYCKARSPDEPGRFAKLLLRLPALRSIGLKCLEHLFFFKLIGDTPIDTFLMEMLESPSPQM